MPPLPAARAGCLHLFDLEDEKRRPLSSLRGHGSPISDAALLPDSARRGRAVSSSVDGAVKLWDASGSVIADLQPPTRADAPPLPLPLSLELASGGGTPRLYCGRGGRLVCVDLTTEVAVGGLPLPDRRPVLHLASAASDPSAPGPSGGSGGGGGRVGVVGSHLVATCCHGSSRVLLWDPRLLPSALPGDATFDSLSTADRRCLVAKLPLPEGAACARQLYLDGSRLLASVDYDGEANAFSRGAQSAALFDVRACSRRGEGALLWEQPVRGDISCFQCRGDRVVVGTGTGSVHLWSFNARGPRAGAGVLEWASGEEQERPERQKRDKFRAKGKPVVRGRFPKTQGFSNSKGFSR